ncbi:hypothetical protein HPP92_017377 [Vanilla planifolia]|nr:hypothetical protein HPP92_017377 [Vanilla planifolia]
MGIGEDQESEDLSECYTCVISHVGGNHVRRMEYFDDGYGDSGVFCGLAPPERQIPMSPSNFLSVCNLCRKELHGVDIFIYKGEKAFCSAECRYQQINSDEQNEQKQGSKAMKSLKLSLRASPFSVIERGCSIVSYSTAPRHTNLYV